MDKNIINNFLSNSHIDLIAFFILKFVSCTFMSHCVRLSQTYEKYLQLLTEYVTIGNGFNKKSLSARVRPLIYNTICLFHKEYLSIDIYVLIFI